MKKCICCGMPLQNPKDYPKNDTSKSYCIHCSREDGSMKSFDEAVKGMSAFLQKTKKMDEKKAEQEAKEYLKKQPAWKNK